MTLFTLFLLAIIQGVTEFLPISSSGHLVIAWRILDGIESAGLRIAAAEQLNLDIAVHVGTLVAICLFLHRDLGRMGRGLLRLLTGRPDEGSRLIGLVVVGSLPVGLVGFLARDWIAAELHNVAVVAWANIAFALLLWFGDRFGLLLRRVEHMRGGEAVFIGLAQVLALMPGTSRSGVTMTAARLLGYEREEAARFSFLLSIPAIAGAGLLLALDLRQSNDLQLGLDTALAAGLAMVTALAALALMMRWLRRASFGPFVIYRLALGAVLLWMVYA